MKINLKALIAIILVIVILVGAIIFGIVFRNKKAEEETEHIPVLTPDKTAEDLIENTVLLQNNVSNENTTKDPYDLSDNMAETINLVVIGVEDNSLKAATIKDGRIGELLIVGYAPEGDIGFKRGQEILVHYNGMIAASFPGQLSNPGKIEIVKEESGIEIPKEALRTFYSSKDNVIVEPLVLTNRGIEITVIDNNEIPFEYSDTYGLDKKEKNPEYREEGYYLGEATEHSTPAYVRNWTRIYL